METLPKVWSSYVFAAWIFTNIGCFVCKNGKGGLKTHDLIFCSRPALFGQRKFSYNGKDLAFLPYDGYWREMKKMATLNLFGSKRVQSFRPIREEEVSRMIAKVSQLVSRNKIVNLSEVVMSLTNTIICRVAFSKRFDKSYEESRLHGLMMECEALLMSFYVSDYFPFMGWLDKLSGLRARLDKNFKEMDSFYQQLIDEHLDSESKHSAHEDIIDVFLQLINDRSHTNHLTVDHLKAVLMNILFGGSDTSASLTIWTMTELMRNPVPLLVPRVAMKRCTIDGFDIQPNTMVYVNAYAIGRDPECWENPEEFLPERFLGTSIDYKGHDFELIPIGEGRRVCPGILMGPTTVELILSNLLYSFDWKLPVGMKKEDIDMTPLPGVTVKKKIPLCLTAKKM